MARVRTLGAVRSFPTRRSSDLTFGERLVTSDLLARAREVLARRFQRLASEQIGRAHVCPVTRSSRMPSSARKKKTGKIEQHAICGTDVTAFFEGVTPAAAADLI